MENIFQTLREKSGLTQEELAQRVLVSRQAVSRWERGETIPNVETLKLLSKEFQVSINTLLGSAEQLLCQCCGMPLSDGILAKDEDGFPNQEYCQWCLQDGKFAYESMEQVIDICVPMMAQHGMGEKEARQWMETLLPTLKRWKAT